MILRYFSKKINKIINAKDLPHAIQFSSLKDVLYITNLKYSHLTSIFLLHLYVHLEISPCPQKFKWLLCIETPVLKAGIKISDKYKSSSNLA